MPGFTFIEKLPLSSVKENLVDELLILKTKINLAKTNYRTIINNFYNLSNNIKTIILDEASFNTERSNLLYVINLRKIYNNSKH